MRDRLPSLIQPPFAEAAVSGSLRRLDGNGRRLGLLLLGFCCCLLLLIGEPAGAATLDASGQAGALGQRGTATQQLDDEAMPELQLFDSTGSAVTDSLLPPLGPMGSSAQGGELLGE